MQLTTRRMALILCTLALNVFYLFSSPATAVLGAKICQQECDAERAACWDACNKARAANSPEWDENGDYSACTSDCNSTWSTCSGNAITCSPGVGGGDVCFNCFITTDYDCVCLDVEDGVCVDEVCYETYQGQECDGGSSSPFCF
jgi:hypothetical protein